jgi:hypothetical protein
MRPLTAFLVLAAGCTAVPEGRFVCSTSSDCPAGFWCDGRRCKGPSRDGGRAEGDAAIDASDARLDAGRDAPSDAGTDAPDIGPDAGCGGGSTCWIGAGGMASGACALGTAASCVARAVIDCDCAPAERARLFFGPASGAGGSRRSW